MIFIVFLNLIPMFFLFLILREIVQENRKLKLISRCYRESLKKFHNRPDSLAVIEVRKAINQPTYKEFDLLWDIDLIQEHGKVYDLNPSEDPE